MSLKTKDKFMDLLASHPRLVTFGLGLAITFLIGTIIGMINDPTHTASAFHHFGEHHTGY
jgi:hypothetical protein